MKYALIKNGVVVNTAEATAEEAASWAGYFDAVVAHDTAGPGWEYNHATGELSPPGPAVLPPSGIAPLDFIRRFTKAERKDIRRAAKQDEDLDDFLYLLQMAESVRLDNQDTIDGVNALEQAGIIAAGRAAEILTP